MNTPPLQTMADSPQRLRPPSSGTDGALRLPVLLYIPNLICYARLLLSFYGLSIVANTVARKQDDARHAAHAGGSSCSVHAMMQTATYYATQITNTGLFPPVANTLIGKGLGHVSAAFRGDSNQQKGIDDGPAFLPSVEPDLLAALLVFVAAAALDVLDGYVARRLNQTSHLGAMLDVVADNMLRSCMWISSSLLDARQALPALLCLSVEWLTLVATQLVAQRKGRDHWKAQGEEAHPRLVQYFFSNNFWNFLGVWGIGSLFLAPLYPLLLHAFPALSILQRGGGGGGGGGGKGGGVVAAVVRVLSYVLVYGRVLSLAVELYFVWNFVVVLVEEQEEERKGGNTANVVEERHKAA